MTTMTAQSASVPDAYPAGWAASLELAFAKDREGRTTLVSNRHSGPLRLIRALPTRHGGCEAVIVHPPGGLVGGDTLDIRIDAGESTSLLCTTPGAQKWYRSTGVPARAATRLRVAAGASVSWLPQPAIVFNDARAEQRVEFDLSSQARFVGWECLILGRQAMGEKFSRGNLAQRLSVRIDGKLAWREVSHAGAGERLFMSRLGWRGHCVCATVLAAGPIAEALVDDWRELLGEAEAESARQGLVLSAGATRLAPSLALARLLGDDSETLMALVQRLWRVARAGFGETDIVIPRIWAT
jgi:urease accessory protein